MGEYTHRQGKLESAKPLSRDAYLKGYGSLVEGRTGKCVT